MGWGGGEGEGEGERSTVTWGATELNGTAANRIWVIEYDNKSACGGLLV